MKKSNEHPLDAAARLAAQPAPAPDPFREMTDVRLVNVPPEAWHLLTFPAYQRKPTPHKVKDIARGLREGYCPAPLIVYHDGLAYRIVDGGHRFHAYRLNREQYGLEADIPALLYGAEAMDQHRSFVLENNKLRMDPTAIIRADNRRICCDFLRELADPGRVFADYLELGDYPIRPLSIVKAALLLHAQGAELEINRLAYYSVSRALDALERILQEDDIFWEDAVVPFLNYEFSLWGCEGRHLVNFGVLGFAYFLTRNRARFFTREGKLVIKTTRHSVSEKRRASGRQPEFEDNINSDFAKLAALKKAWEEPGTRINAEAPRDPIRVAYEINCWFWKNRALSQRLWRPELTL